MEPEATGVASGSRERFKLESGAVETGVAGTGVAADGGCSLGVLGAFTFEARRGFGGARFGAALLFLGDFGVCGEARDCIFGVAGAGAGVDADADGDGEE